MLDLSHCNGKQARRSSLTFGRRNSMSEWEIGISTIDSILEPGGAAAAALTPEQSDGLARLREMLLMGPAQRNSTFVPTDLLDMAKSKKNPSSEFLASEYGGLCKTEPKKKSARERILKVMHANSFVSILSLSSAASKLKLTAEEKAVRVSRRFLPPEWNALSRDSKLLVRDFLTWESLSRWDFNIHEFAEVCGKKSALVLVGWAVLGSPQAQAVMVADCEQGGHSVGDEDGANSGAVIENRINGENGFRFQNGTHDGNVAGRECNGIGQTGSKDVAVEECDGTHGYDFAEELGVPTDKLCAFLKAVEADYKPDNPYHNNIHAADIVQTTHALLQFGAKQFARNTLDVFSLLIAAAVHDVGHPGKNNAYQIKAQTEVALLYNDKAVLENMHAAKAFKMLLGPDRQREADIFESLDEEKVAEARRVIIDAVLGTNLSDHFAHVSGVRGRLAAKGTSPDDFKGDAEAIREILTFVLHMADISAQAKPAPIFTNWAGRCLAEFFAQGDAEKAEGLTVSPMCDRYKTDPNDCQIGFMKYIVQPAYHVLGELVPYVATNVEPIVDENLAYWEKCKADTEKETQLQE